MRAFIIACLVMAAFCFDDEMLITKEFIEEVRKQVDWEVTEYEENIFKDWTVGDAIAFLMPTLYKPAATINNLGDETAPDKYYFYDQYPKCEINIKNQGQCGSCWAFGSTGAASDRFCKATGSIVDLSPQWLVSCDRLDHGCNGGGIAEPFTWMKTKGVVLETCMPYTSGTGKVENCPIDKCTAKPIQPFKLFYCGELQSSEDVEEEKKIILANGPVDTGFAVYEDFKLYKGGVYEHKSGRLLGYHAVEVVGWGSEGKRHWVCRNSWGAKWGEKGYFKIKMGDCDIDGGAACIPKA